MKYTGVGLIQQIHLSSNNIHPYKPLTAKDISRVLSSLNRHNLRDNKGRFRKKALVILNPLQVTKTDRTVVCS